MSFHFCGIEIVPTVPGANLADKPLILAIMAGKFDTPAKFVTRLPFGCNLVPTISTVEKVRRRNAC
jgi:hypothetical protein